MKNIIKKILFNIISISLCLILTFYMYCVGKPKNTIYLGLSLTFILSITFIYLDIKDYIKNKNAAA